MLRVGSLFLRAFILGLGLVLSANVSTGQETKLPRVGVILNDGPGPVFDALDRAYPNSATSRVETLPSRADSLTDIWTGCLNSLPNWLLSMLISSFR
jgi:hypothetical protein